MYPPPAALALAPLAALGKLGLIIVLVLICAAAWSASILLSVRLATGQSGRAHPLVYVIPNLIVVAFVWGNFLLGQPSLLLLALMLGAFVLLQRRSQIPAGALIAIAAAIKAFPAIAIVYLLYRRYWIAAASFVITIAFLLIVLPMPFRGVAQAKQDLSRWSNGMLFKYDEGGVAQRAGRSNSWRNQSIWGVANRMLRHVESDPAYGPHVPVYSNFADLKFTTVNAIIVSAGLLAGLAYVAVMPRRSRRTAETDALEFALLLLLILIFTPLTFGYLFAWLLYPFTVIVQRALTVPDRRRLIIFGAVAVALLALTIPFRVPAQTYGNVFAATVVLFVGLAIELWDVNQRPAPEPLLSR
jgi:preprotein translocase subunit SecG